MVLAIPTTEPGIEGHVGRLEDSPFLLIIDLDLIDFAEAPNPLTVADDPDGELSLVLRLVEEDVQIILVDRCDSEASDYLGSTGIQIIEGMHGDALSALDKFREYCMDRARSMPTVHLDN